MSLQIVNKDNFKPVAEAGWTDLLEQLNVKNANNPADHRYYETNSDGKPGGIWGLLTDAADKQPTFDTDHETYVPTTQTGTHATVDNTNGLNSGTNQVTLSYTYEKGATASHETSKSITAGVSEEVDLEFEAVDSKTTFSFSGTFSYADGTSTSKTESITSSVTVPVTVPDGKVYEAIIYFTQETLTVPYELSVRVSGTTYANPPDAPRASVAPGALFVHIRDSGAAGDESSVYQNDPPGPDLDVGGKFVLDGKAVMSESGGYSTKVLDVTNGDTVGGGGLTDADGGDGIGVYRRLDDAGVALVGTAFDDHFEGGAGADYIDPSGGDDYVDGGDGRDAIEDSIGRNVLHGGGGSDTIAARSEAAGNELDGGAGDDLLLAYSPRSVAAGGAGDDRYVLDERSAGTRIVDAEGANTLLLNGAAVLAFERFGDTLLVHLGGDREYYEPDTDLAWIGFFAGGDNSVNGLDAAQVGALAALPNASYDAATHSIWIGVLPGG